MDPLAGERPVHTRSLDVEVRVAVAPSGSGPSRPALRWTAQGDLIDLRKGGFVPIAADFQTAGVVHHMRVRADFDPASRVLTEIAAEQPAVAFEPSAISEGESCRDPVDRLRALAGTRLSSDSDGPFLDAIGGPRGCSHVLALARHLGATLAWLAESGTAAPPEAWRAGERIFHRATSYDGSESGEDAFAMSIQLTDIHFAPAPELVRPMLRLARQTEVRGQALVAREDLSLRSLRLARRRRGPDELGSAPWVDLAAELSGLLAAPVARGMRRRVLGLLPGAGAGDPVAAALLDLPPALLQCVASCCDHSPDEAMGDPSLLVSSPPADSCWMWRAGGALTRARLRGPGA